GGLRPGLSRQYHIIQHAYAGHAEKLDPGRLLPPPRNRQRPASPSLQSAPILRVYRLLKLAAVGAGKDNLLTGRDCGIGVPQVRRTSLSYRQGGLAGRSAFPSDAMIRMRRRTLETPAAVGRGNIPDGR